MISQMLSPHQAVLSRQEKSAVYTQSYDKKTMMVFGDAKATLTTLFQLLKKTQPTPSRSAQASITEVTVAH